MVSQDIMHKKCCNAHVYSQLFEPNPMEKDLSPQDIYKCVTDDSMFHVFELDMENYQL